MLFPGEPRLSGSSEPVVGFVDDDVILPCRLQPAESVAEKTVEWTRSDLDPEFIHIFREGQELYDQQNSNFRQRTSLFLHKLRNGNMSLKLSRLKPSDEGNYTCKLLNRERAGEELLIQVSVVVGAVSEPMISAVFVEGTKGELKCEAKKWYPKPEMEWRDGMARIISRDSNSTEHDGYYSVYSTITVEMTPKGIYTCTVRQQNIHQSKETNYTIPGKSSSVYFMIKHYHSLTLNPLILMLTAC
ncbi:butyrophilin subfamily 1 member A1-like [Thunnus maccoyii]|uniref:butyrophilin subfamily 1 member A1-like n=1 Tax=Thunnus maccoyii TaxID=8240 RepID=UPI001C4A8ECD|nr:butyrophilin subfamily 1 member A1-like [Thunnus maccoyii]